jgi:hypothetical protein
VLAEQLRMVLQAVLDGIEDDALALPLLLQGVVDHLGFVLGSHASEDLTLGFGNPELLERVLDLVGHVLPGVLHAVLRAHVEVDLVQNLFQVREISTPHRHGLGVVDLQRLESELEHPLGLFLVGGDLSDDLFRQPLLCAEDRLGDSYEVVLFELEIVDGFISRHEHRLSVGQAPRAASCSRQVV